VLDDALRLGEPVNGAASPVQIVRDWRAASTWVHADAARLSQVFRNLVGNAVKFMPDGGTLSVRVDNPTPQQLRVQITDTGIGIPPDMLLQPFQPFEQLHGDHTRFGGLGLGLAISRSIVESLGGTLEAYSDGVGRGATFTVTVPAIPQPVEQTVRAPTEKDAHAHVNGSVRILLVEDHADTARALKRLLSQRGHAVLIAPSVSDALRLAAEHPIDLVISDVGLPDGTGLELMRDLRSRYDLRGIALTGYGMEQDIRNTQDAGFSEHLTKPIDAEQLAAAIDRLGACSKPDLASSR
jgi:CheY-like chemotaxis protein